MNRFQAYEVSHCRENTDGTCEVMTLPDVEAIANDATDPHFVRAFWTVYGWHEGHGVEAIGDYPTQKDALDILGLILGVTIAPFEGTTETFTLDGKVWHTGLAPLPAAERMVKDLADVIEAHLVHGDVDLNKWVLKARGLIGDLPEGTVIPED